MLRASRILAQGVVKRSTGLTGVAVEADARKQLMDLYEKTLHDVKVPFRSCRRQQREREAALIDTTNICR